MSNGMIDFQKIQMSSYIGIYTYLLSLGNYYDSSP